MAELVAIGFGDPEEANRVLAELTRLQRESLIDLEDAVVAVCHADGKVELKQTTSFPALGAELGAFLGTLVGLLLLHPLVGLAVGGMVGAGSGALARSLVDYGVDENFIQSVAETMKPASSALFLLVRKARPDQVLAELSPFRGKVLHSSLSPTNESKLRAALSKKAAEDIANKS